MSVRETSQNITGYRPIDSRTGRDTKNQDNQKDLLEQLQDLDLSRTSGCVISQKNRSTADL